ncbi:MAG: hypothetical protein OWT28_10640 [Firmicutes bacterium]|nr:hypothetical protein [Bacillota bacterium]
MFIPRHQWHRHVGRHVLVHTRSGVYHGRLQGITDTHMHLQGTRLASTAKDEALLLKTLETSSEVRHEPDLVYFPGAAMAIPLAAVAGVTALGLGAMAGW